MKRGLVVVLTRITLSSLLFFCLTLSAYTFGAARNSGTTQNDDEEPSPVLPVSLGIPDQCLFTSAYAFNNGAYPENLVVSGSVFCPDGGDAFPYSWSNGSWSPLDLPEGDMAGGYAESVSDLPIGDPDIVFQVREAQDGWQTWVKSAGRELIQLELLADMTLVTNSVISSMGNHIVGGNRNEGGTERAVRWSRSAAGWLPPEDIGPGQAVATTEDGSVVVGNTGGGYSYWGDGGPWVWTAGPGDGGELTFLEPEAMVYDMTHTGSMIVGARANPCTVPACDFFPAPVYWILEDGHWTMHDLQALDGVDSEAQGVAEVNGQPVIIGYGYTNQNGGIQRVVAWLPEPDGSYGPPMRLGALGGNFDSWAWPTDINRNGLVLGVSEKEPFGATNDVVWNLFGELPFQINPGLNDAWYNPATSRQGFFINVFPDIGQIFLAWFTYDTGRPDEAVAANLGDAGHRWLTAFGPYNGSEATLDIEISQGGIFDASSPVPSQHLDGSITLEFSDCNSGMVTYDIPSINRQGSVPITRIATDNVPLCQTLAAQIQPTR